MARSDGSGTAIIRWDAAMAAESAETPGVRPRDGGDTRGQQREAHHTNNGITRSGGWQCETRDIGRNKKRDAERPYGCL